MATTEDVTERRNGVPPAATVPATEYVPLPEAAQRLGISVHAVRRLRRAGQLQGRREDTPQGYRWMILLPAEGPRHTGPEPATGSAPAAPPDATRDVAQRGAAPDEPATSRDPSGGAARHVAPPDGLVASQRAREMAEYSDALLEPWRRQVTEQAERIGRLEERAEHLQAERDAAQAELEQTRAQLAEALAPEAPDETQNAPQTEPWPEGRPWWRRLLWG